jgi:peptidoglycan-N-acetylglucosamine deacetylase
MNISPTVIMSFDVETTSISRNGLYDDIGVKIQQKALPAILELLEKNEIKSSFFFTGYIAKKYPKTVKMVAEKGHEVASHGMYHDKSHAFDCISFNKQKQYLSESKKILEDISSQEVVSFRAPALRINKHTPKALIECGYKYDSSVAPRRLDMFFSFGSLNKLNWIFAPANPYFVNPSNMSRKGESSILEIPISAFIIPYIGTSLRIIPCLTKATRTKLKNEAKRKNRAVVFLFHPNEIIEEETNVKYQRRAKTFIRYIFVDYIRRNLKIINLGDNAFKLLEGEINYFANNNFNFTSIKEYGKQCSKSIHKK